MDKHIIDETAAEDVPSQPRHDATGKRAIELALTPEGEKLGRRAKQPFEIPWSGWKAVLRRMFWEMISDRASLVAAGCAFYATLALFPAISMMIFLYGLVFDPQTVEPQLQVLREFLPPAGYDLIADRVHQLVTQKQSTLGLGLLISTAITLWSASAGTKAMLAALNIAYEEKETRSFLQYHLTSLGLTLCGLVGVALGIAILVFLPAVISFIGITGQSKVLIRLISMAILLGFVLLSLAVVYRYGPCRRQAKWHWVTPGSVAATVLWMIASFLLSYYIGHIAAYDVTYGPLGAVVGVMMWFWTSAFAVQLGAELNSELELQTVRDSTEGPPKPLGARGAYVADHVAED